MAPLYGTTPDNKKKKTLWKCRKSLALPLLRKEHIPLLRAKYPHYASIGDFLESVESTGNFKNSTGKNSTEDTNNEG